MTTSIGVIGTKGGIGKTSLVAYLAAILADMGFRVLIIDADPQASVSKFYPLHQKAENGIVELLLGENSRELVQSTISKTVIQISTSSDPTTCPTTTAAASKNGLTVHSFCLPSLLCRLSKKTTIL